MGTSGQGLKRLKRNKSVVSLQGMDRQCRSLWLDSGAHSLYHQHCFKTATVPIKRKVVVDGKEKIVSFFRRVPIKGQKRFDWFGKPDNLSKAFIAYLKAYADFVRKNESGIDYYANVDVIYSPALSWAALKHLEKDEGLRPVPIIHHGTDLDWVERHLNAGYKYIGLGGLGQESNVETYHRDTDKVYNLLCDNKDRLPCVRTHGFAMTSYKLLIRYPWWSVDSTSAYRVAGFGSIFLPHRRAGKWDFSIAPYIVAFSSRSSAKKGKRKHIAYFQNSDMKLHRQILLDWLAEIDMPLGEMGEDDEVITYGVASEYNARAVANLKFFQKLCDWLPKWPWPFKIDTDVGKFVPDRRLK
jgi:hypothetical protein